MRNNARRLSLPALALALIGISTTNVDAQCPGGCFGYPTPNRPAARSFAPSAQYMVYQPATRVAPTQEFIQTQPFVSAPQFTPIESYVPLQTYVQPQQLAQASAIRTASAVRPASAARPASAVRSNHDAFNRANLCRSTFNHNADVAADDRHASVFSLGFAHKQLLLFTNRNHHVRSNH